MPWSRPALRRVLQRRRRAIGWGGALRPRVGSMARRELGWAGQDGGATMSSGQERLRGTRLCRFARRRVPGARAAPRATDLGRAPTRSRHRFTAGTWLRTRQRPGSQGRDRRTRTSPFSRPYFRWGRNGDVVEVALIPGSRGQTLVRAFHWSRRRRRRRPLPSFLLGEGSPD